MARYKDAVAWIALNDDPDVLDAEDLSGTLTVALAADLFKKHTIEVALDVIAYRERERGEPVVYSHG